ncbi:MAG TPA: hypothetical protein ENN39_07250 [Desulfonatronum sp.]|nr:hypothetical protein [Desulfonatronum sp.]
MNPSQNPLHPDQDPQSGKRGLLRRLGLIGTLFAAGLLIGLAFFLPREIIWGRVLRATLGHLPNSSWTWQSVGDRGLSRITYTGFDLFLDKTRLFFPELTIQLAPARPVTMQAVTGPTLLADLGWDKTLRFSGGVDMARLLPEQRVQGLVQGEGWVDWADLTSPPLGGEIALHVPGLLIIPPGIMATNLRVQAFLKGNQLTLASIQADGLVALEAEGVVMLDWDKLENSTYSIKGTMSGLSITKPFSASGRLGGVWGQKRS